MSDRHQPCGTLAFLMAAPDTLKREAPDSLMLTGFWYRALPSERVKNGELQKAMLLEIPLVISQGSHSTTLTVRVVK